MIIVMNNDGSPVRRRWRVRFGLGTVLLLTTFLCAVLGIWSFYVQPYRTTSILRARITELDGFYAANPAQGPKWQGDLVEYLVGSGAFVDLIQIDLSSKEITGDDVGLIGRMRRLQTLNLDARRWRMTERSMLASLPELVELSARYTQITDRGASALVSAAQLTAIRWTGCNVTDRTLEAIPEDTNLRQVFARWSDVTEAERSRVAQRHRRLPGALDACHERRVSHPAAICCA